ncbi:hypothetical protein [Paludisphaera borealis]|uniref:Uncharacterized protein n=1 Tax=Paludisphaera borealis TaxID=1387353 RepID=A0A1U7CQK5_9BACT|nr:hypothetical protein [Paludisphaera borealis]APW61188.1 hypothetical protein BSF38_02692 [Paludisphaera borealis]
MSSFVQGINRFDVTVQYGHFNIAIDGIVGANAYIALHDADGDLVYNVYESYMYLKDFGSVLPLLNGGGFGLMMVMGINWFNVDATSGMRLVIWDSTPDDNVIRAMYVCTVKKILDCPRDEGIPIGDRIPAIGNKHSMHMSQFDLFLNGEHWNVNMTGALTGRARIALYQNTSGFPNVDNSYTYLGIKELPGIWGRHGGLSTYQFSGSTWFDYDATTPCYVGVIDRTFDDDTVALRALLKVDFLLATVVENNYK